MKNTFRMSLLTLLLVGVRVNPAHSREGFALDFDGVDDYLEIDAAPSLDVTSEITIESWIKWRGPLGVATFQIILNKDPTVYEMSIGEGVGNSHFLWFLGDITESAPTVGFGWNDGGTITQGDWTHVAIVYTATRVQSYLNGSLTGNYSASGSIRSRPDSPVRIGMRDLAASPSFFNGLIDEVRIWNRARTGQEIVDGMSTRLKGDEDGLVAYWNFDVGSGQYVIDLTENKNHARLGSTSDKDGNDPVWVPSGIPAEIPFSNSNWALYE